MTFVTTQSATDRSPPCYNSLFKTDKIYIMLKTITVLLTTILLSLNSNSQITKSNWILGGVISYASTNNNSENYGVPLTTYNLQVKPNVGYFFIDKLAAGIKIGVDTKGAKGGPSDTDFNLGPFFRYYLLNPEKNVNVITEAGYLYGFETGTASGKTQKNTLSLSAGPVIYFNTVVGMEILISYSTYKYTIVTGSNNTIMVSIGLQVHLEREK